MPDPKTYSITRYVDRVLAAIFYQNDTDRVGPVVGPRGRTKIFVGSKPGAREEKGSTMSYMCFSAGLGCVVTEDLLRKVPKENYHTIPGPSTTIRIPDADGAYEDVETLPGLLILAFTMQDPDRHERVQVIRGALVVPEGIALSGDLYVQMWLGCDYIDNDGLRRQLEYNQNSPGQLAITCDDHTDLRISTQ